MEFATINAKQLHNKIDAGENILVLDVRAADAYSSWKINAKGLQSVNVPHTDILEDNAEAYAQLSKGTEIVIVCNKGNAARLAAEKLAKEGYHVSVLDQGMWEWSQFYHAVTVTQDENMKLIQFNRLGKGCLSYMIISEGQAMIVDPGRHIDEYLELAENENAKIVHVMDTHLHADHISGGVVLCQKTGATYHISASEMGGSDLAYTALEDKAEIKFGSVSAKVMSLATPGHTPGSVSFLVNDRYLLSGDTIFVGGLGRPDLGGKAREWAQSLYDTVFTQIAGLSDDTLVLPTHFADISEINENGYVGALLGKIRQSNEVMRTEDREQFTEMVAGKSGATPPNYEQIVDINRGVVHVDADKASELESGPNRCAVHHS